MYFTEIKTFLQYRCRYIQVHVTLLIIFIFLACQPSNAPRVINTSPGYIDSQFYPEPYGPLADCDWHVVAPENSVCIVKLPFMMLSV